MVSFTWPEHGLPHSLFLPARLDRDVMGWQKRSYCTFRSVIESASTKNNWKNRQETNNSGSKDFSININTNQHLWLLKGLWLSNHLQNWYAIHTGTQQRLREIVAWHMYVMWCSARKRDHKWCEVRTTNSSNVCSIVCSNMCSHLFRASVYVSFNLLWSAQKSRTFDPFRRLPDGCRYSRRLAGLWRWQSPEQPPTAFHSDHMLNLGVTFREIPWNSMCLPRNAWSTESIRDFFVFQCVPYRGAHVTRPQNRARSPWGSIAHTPAGLDLRSGEAAKRRKRWQLLL